MLCCHVGCYGCCYGYRNEEISDTNKVDLHGLHVDEALEVLAELLCRKEQGTLVVMVGAANILLWAMHVGVQSFKRHIVTVLCLVNIY